MHISLRAICDQLQRSGLRVVITFDQSDYRHHEFTREQQRHAKMKFLSEAGRFAFYYVSHAPFLFAFPDAESYRYIRERLRSLGIPDKRLEALS